MEKPQVRTTEPALPAPATLFAGEFDLRSLIRQPAPSCLAELAQILVRKHIGAMRRVSPSTEPEREFQEHFAEHAKATPGEGVLVPAGVDNLKAVDVRDLQPCSAYCVLMSR